MKAEIFFLLRQEMALNIGIFFLYKLRQMQFCSRNKEEKFHRTVDLSVSAVHYLTVNSTLFAVCTTWIELPNAFGQNDEAFIDRIASHLRECIRKKIYQMRATILSMMQIGSSKVKDSALYER